MRARIPGNRLNNCSILLMYEFLEVPMLMVLALIYYIQRITKWVNEQFRIWNDAHMLDLSDRSEPQIIYCLVLLSC